jgi:hypothetical protein
VRDGYAKYDKQLDRRAAALRASTQVPARDRKLDTDPYRIQLTWTDSAAASLLYLTTARIHGVHPLDALDGNPWMPPQTSGQSHLNGHAGGCRYNRRREHSRA